MTRATSLESTGMTRLRPTATVLSRHPSLDERGVVLALASCPRQGPPSSLTEGASVRGCRTCTHLCPSRSLRLAGYAPAFSPPRPAVPRGNPQLRLVCAPVGGESPKRLACIRTGAPLAGSFRCRPRPQHRAGRRGAFRMRCLLLSLTLWSAVGTRARKRKEARQHLGSHSHTSTTALSSAIALSRALQCPLRRPRLLRKVECYPSSPRRS